MNIATYIMRRAIKLPDPSGTSTYGMPEIFDRGISTVVRRAVIIGNGAPGAEHQSIGLVRALGLVNSYTLYRVNRPKGGYNYWLRWLPVSLHRKIDRIITHIRSDWRRIAFFYFKGRVPDPTKQLSETTLYPEADVRKLAAVAKSQLEREGPLLVLASGRDTVPIAENIKKLAQGATFVIQIQHPRCRLDNFDMVITPVHDYYPLSPAARQDVPRFLLPYLTPQQPPDKHVVLTVGALHLADAAMLRTAAGNWHAELAPLKKPLLIVNIGGPVMHCQYGEDLALELISALKRTSAFCGSIRISYSRRTPARICDLIKKEFKDWSKVYIWDGRGDGQNPHLGHLAWGDAFVITADSISMISEACSTGKPVYVIGAERCSWKFKSFHKNLIRRGVVRRFTGSEDISKSWSYPPLNDNVDAAARVRGGLAERGWSIL